jgi:hypothetical protein
MNAHAHTTPLSEVGCSYWPARPAPRPRAAAAAARRPAVPHGAARRPPPLRATISGAPSDDALSPAASLREEARRSNDEVYGRLADGFTERKPEEWRKLIAYSKQWPLLSEGVLARLERRAARDDDEERQRATRRLARRLRAVSDEMAQYSAVVEAFRAAPSRDWEALVTHHRPSLGAEFFSYLALRVRAASASAAAAAPAAPPGAAAGAGARDADALAALAAQVAALVEAHDRVVEDGAALDAASDKFAALLGAESMAAAEAQIDALAGEGRLDPALLLTMARAYAGVKETDKTQEEVKDIMAHLYFKAKESFAAQAPPEARILKFLLAVDDPRERGALLEQAFQPGAELSTAGEDLLCTTPAALLNTVDNVLAAYEGGARAGAGGGGGGTMAGQAAALMNPEVITRLRDLQQLIRKQYT